MARLTAGLCIAVAVVVISGWILGIPQLTTFGRAWTPMVVSTSLVVLLSAVAILLIATPRRTPDWRIVGLLGALIVAIAGVTLANFSSTWLWGVSLYPQAQAWRMAPNTAIAFLFLGFAVMLMGRSRRTAAIAEALLGLALLLAVFMLVAFLFGAIRQSDLMGRVNMSPMTGLCLTAITATLLFLLPNGVFASVTSSTGPGSRIARPLLALVVVTPVTLGLVRLSAEKQGWLSLEYGIALS